MPKLTSSQKITIGMRVAGLPVTLLMLNACSFDSTNLPAPTHIPSSPPTQATVVAVAKMVAAESKVAPPLEISAVRPTDHGPGRFFVCMRETNPTSEKRVVYSIFFDNDVYKGSRQSVILDACETQTFTPVVDTPPPAPPPKASGKRYRRR
jgi:hypothetical protein